MATKKTKKTAKTTSRRSGSALDFQRLIQTSNSYKSLIYGIITVVVLFVVIVLGIRTISQNQQGDINEGAEVTQEQTGDTYTVVEGDTLWSIAETQYGDGFKWTEIAKANNIPTNGAIEKGAKLKLPAIAQISPAQTAAPTAMQPTVTAQPSQPVSIMAPTAVPQPTITSTQPKITGGSYKVVEGDTLWDISIRAYGDGYRWVELARVNNLVNPDLIFVGTNLRLPR